MLEARSSRSWLLAWALGSVAFGGASLVVPLYVVEIGGDAGTLVGRLAPQGIRGEAFGLYGALGALAGAVGSLLGGWLAGRSAALAFGVAGGLVVAGAVVVLGLDRLAAVGRSSDDAEPPAAAAPDSADR